MASDSLESIFAPITWNSTVRILAEYAGEVGFDRGAVVGLTYVETQTLADVFGVAVGARLLDVEGPDGTTKTIALEKVELLEE